MEFLLKEHNNYSSTAKEVGDYMCNISFYAFCNVDEIFSDPQT